MVWPAAGRAELELDCPGHLPPLDGCHKRRASVAIVDTQSVRTGSEARSATIRCEQEDQGPQACHDGRQPGRPTRHSGDADRPQDRDALHALAMDLDAHVSPLLVWLDGGFASTDPIAFLHARGIIAEVIGTVDRKRVQVEPRLENRTDLRLLATLSAPARRR